MKRSTLLRTGAVAFGALVLASAGSAAAFAADDTNYGDQDVTVNVDVSQTGTLSLTVDGDSTSLTEVTSSDADYREFTGTLPTVTVTDTRNLVDIDEDAYWYVLGTASDFSDGTHSISSSYLGWSPSLVDDAGDGTVSVGGDVDGAADGGTGLSDLELLYLAPSSADAASGDFAGVYSATASLDLKVPATTTAAGSYTSVLTLSLFE
ncbi:MAG: hypothetical protein QM626_03815 [Microbacterium sp.]|uniref:hypothetical protein n=1 Tax=Microbacterium sp. TaxID=51671 RepID=UPI0039E53B63